MKLLLGQDVYAITARYLKDLGHDVLTAADIDSSRASDEALLSIAHQQGRLSGAWRPASSVWRAARSSPAELRGYAAAARGTKGLLEILSTEIHGQAVPSIWREPLGSAAAPLTIAGVRRE